MTFSIERSKENKSTIIKLEKATDATLFGIRKALFSSGKDLIATANKAVLAKPRKGRVYIRRDAAGRRRRHVASLPGESHANQTGTLRRSMQWKVSDIELHFGYGVAKASEPDYAEYVEFGTEVDGQVRMEARPTLENSVNENERNMDQHFEREIFKAINK